MRVVPGTVATACTRAIPRHRFRCDMHPYLSYFFLLHVRQSNALLFSFLFSFISIIADGPHHYHPACGHKGSSHLSPVHALQFFYRDASSALLQLVNQWLNFTYYLSRCKFSTLTTRQPMVEFYLLLTFPRFPLRKKEHKSYFGKNRTHDFRTSRCAAYYLLDHSGDELYNNKLVRNRSPRSWSRLGPWVFCRSSWRASACMRAQSLEIDENIESS